MTLELKRKAFSSDYDLYEDGELFVGKIEKQINKGVASGYCPLDENALVPEVNIPGGSTHNITHQDAGSDEISVAGLSGEPAELTTHKSLATGIHGVGGSTVESVAGSQAKVDTHSALTTGVHGVGGSTVASITNIATHEALTTGIHGVGASTIASVANIATHAALSASVHGVSASGFEDKANKAVASGYCELNASVLVPLARIPATLTGKDADTLDTYHAAAFPLLAGRAGGQTLIGGSAVTDILKLQGTSGNGTLTSPAIQLLVGNNGGTIAATILNNGDVGIGTTGPDSKLDVNGTLEVGTGSRGAQLISSNGDNFYLQTYTNTGNPNLWIGYGNGSGGQDSTKEYISMNAGKFMLMNGDVGIRTTGPLTKLHILGGDTAPNGELGGFIVGGTTTAYRLVMGYNVTGNYGWIQSVQNGVSPTPLVLNRNGGSVGIGAVSPTYQLHLSTDSAAKPGTNLWTIASDERLKRDILLADLDRCYQIVKILPLKRFTWKDEAYTEEQVKDRSKLGWVSQDVQHIFPKSISSTEFKGASNLELSDCLGLNSDQIYASMFGAIQKLIEKVEKLELQA